MNSCSFFSHFVPFQWYLFCHTVPPERMTTAKPIQRPTGRTGGRQRNQPRFRSWRSGNRTTDASKTLRSFVSRPQETAFLAIQRETTTGRDPTHHKGKGWKNVPRSPVSTGRLHPSQGFHLRPIEHVFHMRATGTEVPRNPNLGAGFPLRCFQRLSLPNVANRPCRWRDNRHTRGPSTQVLSYYGQASSGFQRAQRIETKLSHDVLNPARVPL